MTAHVTVVGAGVVGLTCAVRLAEAGFPVDVLARELPLETASAAGAGLWLPDAVPAAARLVGGEQTARWARVTHAVLRDLAAHDGTGVALRPGHLVGTSPAAWPDGLADVLPGGERTRSEVTLPVVDPDRYLGYLTRRLSAAGGTLTRLALGALPPRGTVVNCTGVAARALAADPTVQPVQAVAVRLANPGLTAWWHDAGRGEPPLTIVTHGDQVFVGGPLADGERLPASDAELTTRLRDRAARLVPALREAPTTGRRLGVWGTRAAVRLETTTGEAGRTLVHCYGHGGAGHTLSWGCAEDVVAAVSAAARAA